MMMRCFLLKVMVDSKVGRLRPFVKITRVFPQNRGYRGRKKKAGFKKSRQRCPGKNIVNWEGNYISYRALLLSS